MKITKSQLKRLIREEIQREGAADWIASKLGYQKKPMAKSASFSEKSELLFLIRKELNAINLDKIIDRIPADLMDENGEEGSDERELSDAYDNLYGARNRLANALEMTAIKQKELAAIQAGGERAPPEPKGFRTFR